jgi:Bax protein
MKFLLVILLSFFIISINSQKELYFKKYQNLADSLENVYGIPSQVMMGIAYHESAGGTSKVAKHSNNHFGIKGKNHKVNSAFKYYESDTASYKGFCELIASKKFYSKLKDNDNPNIWINQISRSGYAGGSSTWGPRVIGIINKFKLT